MNLIPGQNIPIGKDKTEVLITTGQQADISAFRLYANGKTKRDDDFIFYNQTRSADGTVTLTTQSKRARFNVDLPRMSPDVEKIAFAITTDNDTIVSSLQTIQMSLQQNGKDLCTCSVDLSSRTETALILGEIYKRNGLWKFRFVSQGFNGGLRPLAEQYGVDISDNPTPPPPPPPAPKPKPNPIQPKITPPPTPPAEKIRLSKVSLTKEKPHVNLAKKDTKGVFRVNLNWNMTTGNKKKSGLFSGWFGGGAQAKVDLDLAAYIRLKDGWQSIVQALGNRFGSLNEPPYLKLLGDDRTGEQADGEWIYINGDKLDLIDEVLIFTFIYEGAPNWQATDAVVTIDIENQPKIEVRLSEKNSSLPMCAIARLKNTSEGLRIERIERYFQGHRQMDDAFGWGFSWRPGSK